MVNKQCLQAVIMFKDNNLTNRGRRLFLLLLASGLVSSVTYLRGSPAPVHFRLRRAAVSPTDKSRRNGTLPTVASEKASYPNATLAVIHLIIELIPKSCKRRVCRRCKAARAQTYYGTSSPCQHRRFGKLDVPLRVNYFQKSQHL